MEKIRFNIDELQVQSFATTGGNAAERGTVRAHAPTDQVECYTWDVAWNTCWDSCDRCSPPQNDWTMDCTDNCNDTNYSCTETQYPFCGGGFSRA